MNRIDQLLMIVVAVDDDIASWLELISAAVASFNLSNDPNYIFFNKWKQNYILI